MKGKELYVFIYKLDSLEELKKQFPFLFTKKLKNQDQIEEQKKFNKQLEFQNKIVAVGERVFDRAADGIMRAMQRGENAMESFRNVAMAALFDVGQEMMKLAIFAPLKKAGSNFLMQMAGSIGGSMAGSMFGAPSGGGGTGFER